MRACSTTARREAAQDAAAGRAAARVDDPAAAVAALEAEREVAVAVGVELHAEVDCRSCDARRRPRRSAPRRRRCA